MKKINIYNFFSFIILGSCFLFTACDDDASNDTLGPVASGFVSTASDVDENGSAITIMIGTEASAPEDGTVVISISETGATSANYTTSPAASGGQITIPILAGQKTASFTVTPVDDTDIGDNKILNFSLSSASNGVRLGNTSLSHTLTIIENDGIVLDELTYNLDECSSTFAIPSPFFTTMETGSNRFNWICNSNGQSGNAVEYNAFSSGDANPSDAWFVLEVNAMVATSGDNVDNSTLTALELEMFVFSNFSGNGELNLLYSQDYTGTGDPSAATWTTVSGFQTQLPSGGSRVWQRVTADVSGVVGSTNGYVAVRHTGGIGGSTNTWRLDDFKVFTTAKE